MKPEAHLRRITDQDRWADQDAWRPLPKPSAARSLRAADGASRRRWLPVLTAAAAVVVVAAGVTIAANVGSSHDDSPPPAASPDSAVIPWKPLAAPKNQAVLAADNPTCDPTLLTASSNPPDVVMGSYGLYIKVTDNGPDCSLPNDQVALKSQTADGSEAPLATATGDTPHLVRQVAQGKSVGFSVEFDSSCAPAANSQPRTNQVAVSIAGSDVPVSNTALPDALTNCSSVDFIAPREDDETTYPGLTAEVNLPDTASGSTLDYTVTLSNTAKKSVTFQTCPTYKESANVYGKGKTSQSYQLNCSGARTIAPGSSVTYAMRLDLPDATGDLKVGWFLDHGPSSAGALVHR